MHFNDNGSRKLVYAFCARCNSKLCPNVASLKRPTTNVHFMGCRIVDIDDATFKNIGDACECTSILLKAANRICGSGGTISIGMIFVKTLMNLELSTMMSATEQSM